MTVQWANVLFLGALAVGASVLAVVLILVWDHYREQRRLTRELAEYQELDRPLTDDELDRIIRPRNGDDT